MVGENNEAYRRRHFPERPKVPDDSRWPSPTPPLPVLPSEDIGRMLQRISERLETIEKRLENIEKMLMHRQAAP